MIDMSDSTLRRATLPNGLAVAYQVKAELRQFYEDIFERQVYLRGGITLAPDAVVFDVGANIGLFSLFVGQVCPGAHVFAFEPAPPLAEILAANAAIAACTVTLCPYGLGARSGSASFTFYPHSSGLSSFYPDPTAEAAALRRLIANQLERGGRPGIETLRGYEDELVRERLRGETLTCAVRTLSEVVREHAVSRIDLLKVDVEKSEADVLQGIAPADWPKIRQAVVEVHDVAGRLRGLEELFVAHGFAVSSEQDDLYRGSDRYNLYARRLPPEPPAQHLSYS
jgi:phthiocerol/phenolphthiocerol synthesis type-I polyketide synthase E